MLSHGLMSMTMAMAGLLQVMDMDTQFMSIIHLIVYTNGHTHPHILKDMEAGLMPILEIMHRRHMLTLAVNMAMI